MGADVIGFECTPTEQLAKWLARAGSKFPPADGDLNRDDINVLIQSSLLLNDGLTSIRLAPVFLF